MERGTGTVCFPPWFLHNFLSWLHGFARFTTGGTDSAILSIRVLIRHAISRLLYAFNFRVDRSLRIEKEREERTERKRARTDGTMVVLPDDCRCTDTTGTSLRVEPRVGSH